MNLSKIQYKLWNERDLEIPAIIEFVKSHPDIKSALDVGAHWSWNHYAPELRKLLERYDGIDILLDEQTKAIVNNYYVKNVLDFGFKKYDLVFCISSIEHSGISTYKTEDYKKEQRKVFKRIFDLSNKYVFLTFPFGKEALHEGEFANITREQLKSFQEIGGVFKQNVKFYFSEAPQQQKPYKEISLEEASQVEYIRELGTRCVCFFEIEKL